MKLRLLMLAGILCGAVPACADAGSATITLSGSVDKACHIGAPSTTSIPLGALAATDTGALAPVTAPSVTIAGSWCNTGSTVGVIATPLVAQHYSGVPTSGFTKAVDYTATASGWTATPASYVITSDESGTVTSSTTPASQPATTPAASDIIISLSNFVSPVAGDRLVADTNYSGTITVTLAVSP
jgi:hypothetical protein